MRTAFLVCFALTLSAVAAPVPKALKKASDADLLEGKWEGVSVDDTGVPRVDTKWRLHFAGGKLMCESNPTDREPDVPFTLDETQSPKHIDIAWKTWGKSSPAPLIYKLDGDTLTWCHAQPGKPRPTEFKGGGPNGQHCFVYKRVKE